MSNLHVYIVMHCMVAIGQWECNVVATVRPMNIARAITVTHSYSHA